MIFPAAGAAFLPERLGKSARNRVLMLPRERADFTDHFLKFSCKSVGWSSSSGRLKSGKRHQKNSWLNARYILGWWNQWRKQRSRPEPELWNLSCGI